MALLEGLLVLARPKFILSAGVQSTECRQVGCIKGMKIQHSFIRVDKRINMD